MIYICNAKRATPVFFEGDYIFFNGQTGKWSRGADKEPISPRLLPAPIVADGDADSLLAELGNDRAVAAREDSATGAVGDAVELAPFAEGQHLGVVLQSERRGERGPSLLLALMLLLVLALRASRSALLDFEKGHSDS
jgi:hypothetical protein